MSELLRVKDLVVKYKTDLETVSAVNGISFSLNKGETIGLVGETGAGKTTTAMTLLRLLPERTGKIERGEIIFNGENLLEADKKRMREIRGEEAVPLSYIKEYHDALFEAYCGLYPDQRQAVTKMKELWYYMRHLFEDRERELKEIKKAASPAQYREAARRMFA